MSSGAQTSPQVATPSPRHRPPPLSLQQQADDRPPSRGTVLSPTRSPRPFYSPPASPRHAPIVNPRSRRPTPPPAETARDLELFATQCHAWYYDQNADAGRLVSQTMSTIPDTLRAPYIKLQASIRSAYHASVNARRRAELKAHLSSISPGGSLTPLARADPRGPVAAKERYSRLRNFIDTWCVHSLPGPRPFFEGLWCLMRLQTLPERIGGAGGHRLEWELDDAVFQETAGKEFMLEAVTIMKGVLGFDDASLLVSNSLASSCVDLSLQSVVNESPSPQHPRPRREPSDPFLDASVRKRSYFPKDDPDAAQSQELPTPISAGAETTLLRFMNTQDDFDRLEEDELRIWRAPDLSNSEFTSLVSLFPASITSRALPRLNHTRSRKVDDIEAGDIDEGRPEVRCGTGRIWQGQTSRTGRWKGSWWQRFLQWCQITLQLW